MNTYTNNSLKECVLEDNIGYPKEVSELHNDYLLVQDKIEIEREMLPNYQIPISMAKTVYVYEDFSNDKEMFDLSIYST